MGRYQQRSSWTSTHDQVWTGVKNTITEENVWIRYVPQVFSSDKDYDTYCWLIIIEE
jgi:hypothetical protein